MSEKTENKTPMSKIRKKYFVRLAGRCIIFVLCVLLCIFAPDRLNILQGAGFFKTLSPLHLLWILWVIDMILQLIPIKNQIPLGSQKLFKLHFKPIREKINPKALKEYVISTTHAAYKVLIIWTLLLVILGVLYYKQIINSTTLFMVSVLFYVCDLICVLIWCPFRLLMKTRCCTTCRIFNWDHLMMFTPMMFINSFFSISLVLLSLVVWLVWELCFIIYPERFWDGTNEALKCSNCTDKLCTQYCQKLRK